MVKLLARTIHVHDFYFLVSQAMWSFFIHHFNLTTIEIENAWKCIFIMNAEHQLHCRMHFWSFFYQINIIYHFDEKKNSLGSHEWTLNYMHFITCSPKMNWGSVRYHYTRLHECTSTKNVTHYQKKIYDKMIEILFDWNFFECSLSIASISFGWNVNHSYKCVFVGMYSQRIDPLCTIFYNFFLVGLWF